MGGRVGEGEETGESGAGWQIVRWFTWQWAGSIFLAVGAHNSLILL